ncbi:MAG: glycerophosphodiester phosphodiesterase [Ilumatobacteraceae bacterium]
MAVVEQQQLPSLNGSSILFAHRGARAHAPENTMEAFHLAIRLGATGLESDVWVTNDNVAVLDHDGKAQVGRLRSRAIRDVAFEQLPAHIPKLIDVLELLMVYPHLQLSLDIKDDNAFSHTLHTIEDTNASLASRVWLCHPNHTLLQLQRRSFPEARLVNSVRLNSIREGVEVRCASLANDGIDALNMRFDDWNGGLVTLAHRFSRFAFGWNLQQPHEIRTGLRMGLDGIFSDYVDRMVDAATERSL